MKKIAFFLPFFVCILSCKRNPVAVPEWAKSDPTSDELMMAQATMLRISQQIQHGLDAPSSFTVTNNPEGVANGLPNVMVHFDRITYGNVAFFWGPTNSSIAMFPVIKTIVDITYGDSDSTTSLTLTQGKVEPLVFTIDGKQYDRSGKPIDVKTITVVVKAFPVMME